MLCSKIAAILSNLYLVIPFHLVDVNPVNPVNPSSDNQESLENIDLFIINEMTELLNGDKNPTKLPEFIESMKNSSKFFSNFNPLETLKLSNKDFEILESPYKNIYHIIIKFFFQFFVFNIIFKFEYNINRINNESYKFCCFRVNIFIRRL